MTDTETDIDGGVADTGGENTPWFESYELDDETKGYIQNKGWDNPVKAIKSYRELEKFNGANENDLIRLPKDRAAEGAMDAVWNKLGRPESADKYIEAIEFPDGVQVDKDRIGFYAEIAHKAGITQDQFKAVAQADAEYWGKMIAEKEKQVQATQEAEYNALMQEWGSKASEREELSRRGLRALLPQGVDKDDMISKIEAAIGTAATLKLFANAGDKLAREDRVHDSGGDRPFGYTREQALSDRNTLMSELKADRNRLDAYNRGHGSDYEKMQRINKIIAQ